jgi:hypothetical protein
VFSHMQSWYVLPKRPPHRIHDEHGIIRGILFVYLKFLKRIYCSYVRTLWELFQTLGRDTNHNEKCQELKLVLISSFTCIPLQIISHMHSLMIKGVIRSWNPIVARKNGGTKWNHPNLFYRRGGVPLLKRIMLIVSVQGRKG